MPENQLVSEVYIDKDANLDTLSIEAVHRDLLLVCFTTLGRHTNIVLRLVADASVALLPFHMVHLTLLGQLTLA